MLSDEEKEAIEWLKRLVKLNKRDNLDDTFAEILLNLIEKQSKEIEELKRDEETFIHLGECIGEKKVEDKIKAKIEELNDLNSKFAQRVIKGKEVYLTEMVQNILQSLLEKE